MLKTLVQWILSKTLSRLLQYHPGEQLDLCISGALPPIQHFSDVRCPSVRRNELLRRTSMLHRSPLFLLLTFVRSHAGIFSNFTHSLSTAAVAAGIFIELGFCGWFCSVLKQSSHRGLQNLAFEFLLRITKIFKSSTESTNSTSLIHSTASATNCEQVYTSVLNLIFQ